MWNPFKSKTVDYTKPPKLILSKRQRELLQLHKEIPVDDSVINYTQAMLQPGAFIRVRHPEKFMIIEGEHNEDKTTKMGNEKKLRFVLPERNEFKSKTH